ncbi:MAG: DUF1015 domain-containing protein [Vicinamibacterales bacterium]
MATIRPFRALRPEPAVVERTSAVPYDVVNTEEAAKLAEGNPLSFLRVSRAEIELPPGTDLYSDAVYEKAKTNFERLRQAAPLVFEDEPAVYFYQQRMGSHVQTGLAACYSVDEYEADLIKKHERTRRDKEDDRTRHIITLRAQTGPVFLVYRASPEVDQVASEVTSRPPLFDFVAVDGVGHTVWRVQGKELDRLIEAFRALPHLYIADGHHRAASAARTRKYLAERGGAPSPEADWFLAVAFPHDQMQVLPYNRVVRDLAGMTPDCFLSRVRQRFDVAEGKPAPEKKGQVSMYVAGKWYAVSLSDGGSGGGHAPGASGTGDAAGSVIGNLDVSLLQERLLAPLLHIADPRTDKRIDFVGGIRGTRELQSLVDSGSAAVAFSLFPVSVDDLMRVADAGEIMPPKSTWFEPKLRDGLLIHVL